MADEPIKRQRLFTGRENNPSPVRPHSTWSMGSATQAKRQLGTESGLGLADTDKSRVPAASCAARDSRDTDLTRQDTELKKAWKTRAKQTVTEERWCR